MRNTVYIYKNLRLLRNLQAEVFSICIQSYEKL